MIVLFCWAVVVVAQQTMEDCSERKNCSGHGDCVAKNVCSCYDGYYEDSLVGCELKSFRDNDDTIEMMPTPPPIVASIATYMRTVPTGSVNGSVIDTTIILLIIAAAVLFLVIVLVAVLCIVCALRPNSTLALSYRARKDALSNRLSNRYRQDDEFVLGPKIDDDRPPRESFTNITGAAMVTALYDFRAQQPGDLSFKTGDQIKLLQHSGNWWQGILNGQVGVFPRNYVALTRESTWQAPAPTIGNRMPRESYSPFSKTKRAVALYDFNGTDDNDLSFKKGDVITVTKGADTWWEGQLKTGKVGVFPVNKKPLIAIDLVANLLVVSEIMCN